MGLLGSVRPQLHRRRTATAAAEVPTAIESAPAAAGPLPSPGQHRLRGRQTRGATRASRAPPDYRVSRPPGPAAPAWPRPTYTRSLASAAGAARAPTGTSLRERARVTRWRRVAAGPGAGGAAGSGPALPATSRGTSALPRGPGRGFGGARAFGGECEARSVGVLAFRAGVALRDGGGLPPPRPREGVALREDAALCGGEAARGAGGGAGRPFAGAEIRTVCRLGRGPQRSATSGASMKVSRWRRPDPASDETKLADAKLPLADPPLGRSAGVGGVPFGCGARGAGAACSKRSKTDSRRSSRSGDRALMMRSSRSIWAVLTEGPVAAGREGRVRGFAGQGVHGATPCTPSSLPPPSPLEWWGACPTAVMDSGSGSYSADTGQTRIFVKYEYFAKKNN